MATQKTYPQKIILTAFLVSAFFVFSNIASAITGSINTSVENQVKVCKDNTCVNPKPGIIYFKVSSDSPLVVDTEKGLSGKVWGDELGWVTFNPPYGGVFFANVETGLLKGTAWSETSGAINFSVTGQKVVIDPKTGEWDGWAWASGPYGGWVKFDCKENTSCIHTIWNNQTKTSASPTSSIVKNEGQSFFKTFSSSFDNLFNGIKEILKEDSKLISYTFNTFASSLTDLFYKTGQMVNNTYDSIASLFAQSFLVNKNEGSNSPTPEVSSAPEIGENSAPLVPKEIGGKFSEVYDSIVSNLDKVQTPKISPAIEVEEAPVLTDITEVQPLQELSPRLSLGENLKSVFQEKSEIMSDNLNALVTSSTDLFDQMANIKYKIFDKAGDGYYTFSSNLINLRSSVLEGVNNLFK